MVRYHRRLNYDLRSKPSSTRRRNEQDSLVFAKRTTRDSTPPGGPRREHACMPTFHTYMHQPCCAPRGGEEANKDGEKLKVLRKSEAHVCRLPSTEKRLPAAPLSQLISLTTAQVGVGPTHRLFPVSPQLSARPLPLPQIARTPASRSEARC